MDTSRQRQFVLLISVGMTASLLGAVVGGLTVSYFHQDRSGSLDILPNGQKRLDSDGAGANRQKPSAWVRVATAEWKPVQPLKPIVGRLAEVRKATVASEVEGQVVEMPVEEGMLVVGRETLLARVDDVWNQLALEQGRSRAASIQARLGFASSELARIEQLLDRNVIAESELDGARARVDELEADLAEAQAAMKEATERKIRCVIRAPFDGIITAKHAELGEHLSPGTPIVDIVSRGQIDAQINVPESLIDLVSAGQLLPVRIDPLRQTISGQVVSITPYGVSASRTFPVRVRLEDPQGRLKVGMSVTAMVAAAAKQPSLVVSQDAVLDRPDGSTIWVAIPNETSQGVEVHPVSVVVRTRIRSECAVEAETLQGRTLLVPGAKVVIEGAEHLLPGQSVRIVTLAGGGSNGDPASDGPGDAEPSSQDPDGGTAGRER